MRTTTVQKCIYQIIAVMILGLILVQTSFAGTHFSESSKILYRDVVDKQAELVDKDILKQQIHYPRAAFLAGFEGKVIAKVYVDESGKVSEVDFVKTMGGGFETSIKQAIMKSKFNPAIHNGEKVKSVSYLSFKFELK